MKNPLLEVIDLTYCGKTIQLLTVGNTSISSLDLSKATELESLEINNTQLNECPNLTACTGLEYFRCEGNGFDIDLSGLSRLQELFCYDNKITKLDLSNCPYIQHCMAWNNEITEINLEGCEYLKGLSIDNNKLSKVDLTPCNPEVLYLFEARENPSLFEVKVWPDFDIANPPEQYQVSDYTKYVYEFSE